MAPVSPELGVCQWFHYEAYDDVEKTLSLLRELGARRLRTGISWADYHRPRGREFADWLVRSLDGLDVLLSVWHTPPSRAEGGVCASPPSRLADYAEFAGELILRYGDRFSEIELWNEPNNRYKWDFERFDPGWRKFGEMIRLAARAARSLGKRTVLGGMIPADPWWLGLMRSHGALEDIDVIAFHAFPGMWWDSSPCWDWFSHWAGWEHKVDLLRRHSEGRPIWVTETGLATWDPVAPPPDGTNGHGRGAGAVARLQEQAQALLEATRAPAERVYWYGLVDLDPRRDAIEGYHVDENEYHMGFVTYNSPRKPAFATARALFGAEESGAGAAAGGESGAETRATREES